MGRCAWMNELDADLQVRKNEVIKIVRKEKLWLELRFYLYLLSIKPRKFINRGIKNKWNY